MQLNKYEKFIDHLCDSTDEAEINWKSRGSRSPITIKNEDFISRAFSCDDYKKDSVIYFFKYLIPHYLISGGEEFDSEECRVFIYEDGNLIKELDGDEVDASLLLRLYNSIDKQNESSSGFFDDFD